MVLKSFSSKNDFSLERRVIHIFWGNRAILDLRPLINEGVEQNAGAAGTDKYLNLFLYFKN